MPNTAETARTLLYALTDDELARYGEIARDQASAELQRWWLQAVLALAALISLSWATAKWGIAGLETVGIEVSGFGRSVVLGIGLGLALAYSPYRRLKNWTLWNRHRRAVIAEQARRSEEPQGSASLAARSRGSRGGSGGG